MDKSSKKQADRVGDVSTKHYYLIGEKMFFKIQSAALTYTTVNFGVGMIMIL